MKAASISAGLSECDVCVPMVDKIVDDGGWKKQTTNSVHLRSKGSPFPEATKSPEGVCARAIELLMVFVVMIVTLVRAFSSHIVKRSPDKSLEVDDNFSTYSVDYSTTKEELRPPSPAPGFAEMDLLSSVMKWLAELEEKIDVLQSKPSEMPSEKEELLNAAVRRVDALEAELIVTKEALYDALMKQEELLAYIDRQEFAKFEKKKFCF